MKTAQQTMLERRSIRKFESTPVTEQQIRQMLEAAMAAPSGHNAQPWHFVVVDDRNILDQLAEVHKYAKMLFEAPLCIAVCGEPAPNGKNAPLWPQDCAAATQSILLAATELGLGSVWLGIYPSETSCAKVSQLLQVPDQITPFGLIAIGHPAETKEARTQYTESKVHRNQWSM